MAKQSDEDEQSRRRRAIAEERESAIESMEEWFREQFEDPANETPWDGEDKAYVFIWGGPFDAQEMISEYFEGVFPDEWIAEAVENIEMDGISEWAPRSIGDFYDHPEPEDDLPARLLAREVELRNSIERRLGELERVVEKLPRVAAQIGHNYPPEEIGLPPYNDETHLEIESTARDVRGQLSIGVPNREILRQSEGTFRRIGNAILAWLGRKADLIVDEVIKNGVKAGIWSSVAAVLMGLADDIIELISVVL